MSLTVVGTPKANPQQVTLAQDTPTALTLTGSDPNSPALALNFNVLVQPAHAQLTGSGSHVIYTPTANYVGPDSFQFTASNGTATSVEATVSLTVANHPTLTANADTYTVAAGTPLNVNAAGGILSNDTGSPITIVSPLTTGTPQTTLRGGYVTASGTATPTSYTQPFTTTTAHGGTVTLYPDGSFNYAPAANYTGSDSFHYSITDSVQDYKTDLPILGTFNGVPLTAGGYGSSLYPVPGSTNEFYGLEDRGPNATAPNGNIVEPTPNYDPAIGKFLFVNGQAILEQYIPLKDGSGNPYSGRVNSQNPTGETLVDLNGTPQPQDPNGYDSEGLVALPDGTFWVSDEYGPYITHFDATGKQIGRLSPLDGSLPAELQTRLPNRGLEGLTITPDGTTLVAMIQSALSETDIGAADPKKIDITRLVTYQLATANGVPAGTEHEYLYQLDNPVTNKTANSELTALDATHFLVDERDGNMPGVAGTPYYKKLWEIDITGATDVGPNSPLIGQTVSGGVVAYDNSSSHLGLTIGGKSLERSLITLSPSITYQNTTQALATLSSDQIVPVAKGATPYLDVGALITTLHPTGHFFSHDKIEGVAVVNGGTQLVLSNDSDFHVGGVSAGAAPYQLVGKTTTAGVYDDGEFLVVNLTRLPAGKSTATVTINVVNEPPVGTSNTVSTPENTPYTFAAADFGSSDPNNTPANNLKAVEITTLPAGGTLTDHGAAVDAGDFISVADLNAQSLQYTPASNAEGTSYDGFTFQVQDDGGSAAGGVDTDPTPRTMTINITEIAVTGSGTSLSSTVVTAFASNNSVYLPGDLLVSRSVYTGTAATVTVGSPLPGGGVAVADGSSPGVWANEAQDGSFGVTSPIYLDQITPSGSVVGNSLNVTSALNNGHVDPTNPVATTTARAVIELDGNGNLVATPVNAYSGNNGRAAILGSSGDYYLVGNAGNGSGNATILSMLSDNSGVQMIAPGSGGDTTVVGQVNGTFGSATGYQRGFSIGQTNPLTGQPYGTADKTGKDDNFRGLTIFNNTLYVTKGSGGNGVDTGYQVGAAGSLPTLASAGTNTVVLNGNGNNKVTVGDGNAASVTVTGDGNDNITVGNGLGDAVTLIGNGNDNVTLGTGSGTIKFRGTGHTRIKSGPGWTSI